jgi:hypothetical protein
VEETSYQLGSSAEIIKRPAEKFISKSSDFTVLKAFCTGGGNTEISFPLLLFMMALLGDPANSDSEKVIL